VIGRTSKPSSTSRARGIKPAVAQIELLGVTKRYAGETAVDGVDLTFRDFVTTAVVGPSGSGKSTLLQLINGLVRPDAGEIRLFDRGLDYADIARVRRKIGYAVQGTGLFPHMTVEGNIGLLGRIAKWDAPRRSARIGELMRLVELPAEYGPRYPHELSGGEKQRVGLCRAMMLNPPVFLLDEPFGALDPITRSEIHQEFTRLQQSEARTIVLVTHDLREAIHLAEELVVLHRGRVVQHGKCDDVIRNPSDKFVSRFFEAQIG